MVRYRSPQVGAPQLPDRCHSTPSIRGVRQRPATAATLLGAAAVAIALLLAVTAAATRGNAAALIVAGLLPLLAIAVAAVVGTTRRLERAEALQAAAEAQVRTVQQAVIEAIQIFGPDGSVLSRNRAAQRIFELGEHELTKAALTSKWEFVREDRSPLPVEERPLAMAIRTGQTAERVVAGILKRADGTVKWLSMSTFPIRGPHQEVLGYVSCAWDITERTEISRESQVLRRATEQLSSSLVRDQVIRALTGAAADLCSAPGEQQRRAQLFAIDAPPSAAGGGPDPAAPVTTDGVALPVVQQPYLRRVIATRQVVSAELHYEEFEPVVADAVWQDGIRNCAWVPLTRDNRVFAVLAVAGSQHGLISSAQLQDLKTLATMGELALRNAEAHEQVEQLARTDPLTGVGNRRALDDRLDQLPRGRFALVAIDVDDLKKVNDAHGHDAGDQLLARLAPMMAAELRPSDLLARTGGDEFVALLFDCDAQGAVELSKRLQLTAARLSFPWGTPSISVGSAAGASGDAPAQIAKAADQALYAAKQATKVHAAMYAAQLAATARER